MKPKDFKANFEDLELHYMDFRSFFPKTLKDFHENSKLDENNEFSDTKRKNYW